MRILSMTATFGKLSRQTLTLEPGLNIIEAPNEWGKSTWCAFVMAMLYGIDTGSRSKNGFLADKEHYKPWSGEPMAGRMDILWNGREITIERREKSRVPLGEVKAYETRTGIAVPELCVLAPGQVLLGVERSVFERAGFLKLSQMPVTEDESLRRRLNELVTTGDESGASDDLFQKLNKLKNACQANSKKGLLPEQMARLVGVESKLRQLADLKAQEANTIQRQQALEMRLRDLQNHKQALEYAEQLGYAQKLAAAQVNRDTTAQMLQKAVADCADLPTLEELNKSIAEVRQLRDRRDALHAQAQLQPPMPQMPVPPEPFRGRDPEKLLEEVRRDLESVAQMKSGGTKVWYTVGIIGAVLGIALLALTDNRLPMIAGAVLLLGGAGIALWKFTKQKQQNDQISRLRERYRGIPMDLWEQTAAEYAAACREYTRALAAHQQTLAALNQQIEENIQAIRALTGGDNLAGFEEICRQQQQMYSRLQEQRSAAKQAEDVLQALTGAGKQVPPPAYEDTLTYTALETERLLAGIAGEQQLLRQNLGQCQGQMAALGREEALLQEKQQVQIRIAALELHYRALVRAQEALEMATQELQRRFAPRISQRSQDLFGRLTGHRYQRMSLLQDLSVEVEAEGENGLRGTLYRSDGTVDQLYLALRLAVAEELTPTAPLVLDDALVRFDDIRLAEALEILREIADQKQVILFTCQSREKEWRNKNENH